MGWRGERGAAERGEGGGVVADRVPHVRAGVTSISTPHRTEQRSGGWDRRLRWEMASEAQPAESSPTPTSASSAQHAATSITADATARTRFTRCQQHAVRCCALRAGFTHECGIWRARESESVSTYLRSGRGAFRVDHVPAAQGANQSSSACVTNRRGVLQSTQARDVGTWSSCLVNPPYAGTNRHDEGTQTKPAAYDGMKQGL